jgi:N6-adenosine-specific RNA methylase IME4
MADNTIAFHRLANIFPLIEGDELYILVASIGANGLREPIILFEDKILDGRNRYRACLIAGADPRFETLPEGTNALEYVVDRNLRRRQLNDDQRRMVAARIANLRRGRPMENGAECAIKIEEAAKLVNVDKAGTRRARTIVMRASSEIQDAVDRGKLSVVAAAQAAKFDPEKQRRIAEEARAGRTNVVRTVIKQEARAAREREVGQKQLAGPSRKFGVIVEDFEWDYEVRNRETGMDRHAANHYETASDAHTPEEIVERTKDRFACAADDCVLLMWAPGPHLAVAIDVLRLRGFKYVSHYIWRKDRIITGWWARYRHELLLIGTKGKPPCPAPGTQLDSVIDAARLKHSAKPDCFLEMIEQYFPTLPKIELNRRGPARLGWEAWGKEAIPDNPGRAKSSKGLPLLPTPRGSTSRTPCASAIQQIRGEHRWREP